MARSFYPAIATLLLLSACGSQMAETGGFDREALMDPQAEALQQQAPDEFDARFETSAGSFVVHVERAQAPHGADRFYNLVRHGFYDGQRFFRVVPGFVVQFGMHGDPELMGKWQAARIPDDPVVGSNQRGTLCFAAQQMPNTRTTQLFISLGDNSNLDRMRFAPFGTVSEGMEVVDHINAEYGEQPRQDEIGMRGNEYLEERFPRLDYIVQARVTD